ncbi:MAG: hypothetical protein ACOC1X_02245 [Promethearchaeota archaeon]
MSKKKNKNKEKEDKEDSEIDRKIELEKLRHKNRMEEIEARRKAEKQVVKYEFDKKCEYHRIKNADIKRNIARRKRKH